MTTSSPKLGLVLPTEADPFSTADVANNWSKIDAAPGIHICTSTTRPTWTSTQAGREIFETNTNLRWVWTGTTFIRTAPVGLLKTSGGDWAIGERPSDFSTASKTYVKVLSITGVVVPDGLRPIRVDVNWVSASNPQGTFYGAIFRSDTNNSGPLQVHWNFGVDKTDDQAGGGTYFSIERGGLPAGTYDFSFQIHSTTAGGGTSTLGGDSSTPIGIFVTEL